MMKCDELKVYHCNEWHNEYTEFYQKYDVDAAIDELKAAHHKERHEYIKMVAELKKEIESTKVKFREFNDNVCKKIVDALRTMSTISQDAQMDFYEEFINEAK